jgi:hypothetical protein
MNGETYRFYVVKQGEELISKGWLPSEDENNTSWEKRVNGERKVSINFAEPCKMYVDFCNRYGASSTLLEIKEEMNTCQMVSLRRRMTFFNSRLTDQRDGCF